jgi:hypothetical protein
MMEKKDRRIEFARAKVAEKRGRRDMLILTVDTSLMDPKT